MAMHDQSPTRRSVLAQCRGGCGRDRERSRSAQPAPAERVKGPLVWMNMDQKALDDAYDQAVYAPNRDIVIKRCVRNSELARERLGAPKRFAYGPTPFEGLDVFTAKTPNAPIMIYIHGGSWRVGTASEYHYAAELFLNAGANFVVPDFANVGDVGGSLLAMADQIRRSVAWVYKNAKSFGGDPERIYVSGQSSGGHWIGVLLTTDWKDYGVPMTVIKGGALGQRHVRSQAGAAVEALGVREVHRRDGGEAQRAAPSRQARGAGRAGLWLAGDAGVPAPEPRLLRRREGGRQAGHAVGDGGLQSLRGHGI